MKTEQLGKAFNVWWPQLDDALKAIPAPTPATPAKGKTLDAKGEVLEEILDLVRHQQRLLNDPESLVPPDYLRYALRDGDTLRNDRTFERLHESVIELERYLGSSDIDDSEILDGVSRIHDLLHELVGDDKRMRMKEKDRMRMHRKRRDAERLKRKRQLDLESAEKANAEKAE